MKLSTFTVLASLAMALASCSKKDEPAVITPAAAKPDSGATEAPPPSTAPDTAKEASLKTAPPKEELEAVTPATAASQAAADAEKAKLQAEQKALQEEQAKAAAANDTTRKAELESRMKQVEQKINALPRPDLGEGFEARASSADDGTRAALDKLLDKAPKNAPAPGTAPASAPTPAPANQ